MSTAVTIPANAITLAEAARLIGCDESTAREWAKTGRLKTVRVDGPPGHAITRTTAAWAKACGEPQMIGRRAGKMGVHPKRVKRVRAMLAQGRSKTEIATALGITQSGVTAIIRRSGIRAYKGGHRTRR